MALRNIVFLLLLFGCSESQQPIKKTTIKDCENEGYINVQEWRKEILYLDSVKYNNEPFLKNSLDYYQKIFGDEIENYSITYEDISLYGNGQEQKNRHVFNGALVDQVGKEAIINTLDFSKIDGHLVAGELILKEGTNVSEIFNAYPRSCRLIPSNGNLWSGFIELKVHQSGLDFRRIFLIFQREKLRKLKIVNLGH